MTSSPTAAHPFDFDPSRPQRVHIVGVGGAGMSAIATVLAAMGHEVSGSDLRESPGLERLRALGVRVAIGHDAGNLGDVDVVTVSTAIPPTNPEVRAARERAIPVLRRADSLTALSKVKRSICVAGTHGKTTTSSMLALALIEGGKQPSFIIGGDVNEIGSGAAWSAGESFVVEADESDGTFNQLVADAVVVTNIEADHLDFHGSFERLRSSFERFVRGASSGLRVLCYDDAECRALAGKLRAEGEPVITYGTGDGADVQLRVTRAAYGSSIAVRRNGTELGSFDLPMPGLHNARNAGAALSMALEFGVSFAAASRALGRFAGVARRFEQRGMTAGVTFVDDYAHLASEVAAAIEAARSLDPKRLVCVFQPHRYTRTNSLWHTFADAFAGTDQLIVTDIYSANEAPIPGVSGKLVVNAVLDAHPWHSVAYLPQRRDVVAYLVAKLQPGDLCLSLGAGDLTVLADEVQPELAKRVR